MSTPRSPSRVGRTTLATQTRAHVAVGRTGPRVRWSTRAAVVLGDAIVADVTGESVSPSVVARMKLTELTSLAPSRHDVLQNPPNAYRLDARSRTRLKRCRQRPDVQIVVCDGLAPGAITSHARALLTALAQRLRTHSFRQGTPIFVRNGRTAIADEVTRAVRPRAVCLIVGQRPHARAPHALTAHVIPGRASGATVTVRDIHTGGVTPRAAARTLVEALAAILGDTARARRRR